MRPIQNFRWVIVFLLFAATAISYVDRQVLTVVAPTLRDELGISNTDYAQIVTAFLVAYTFMQAVTGWIVDRVGTRIGFSIIMTWWSVAAMLHAFGNSVASLAFFRFLLGAGEAGSWAACVRAVSEWIPKRERGLANSLWGFGVSAGLVVSVPVVAWINLTLGWRAAFVLVGLVGFIWLAAWLWLYRVPEQHSAVTAQELEHIKQDATPTESTRTPYLMLLRSRNVWAVILARMLADPWAWFYYFWIPEFLTRTKGFTPADIGKYAWIPFLAQGVGILLGGPMSDALIRRGMRVVSARMTIMLLGMLLMLPGLVAAFSFPIVTLFLGISSAMLGFGLWAPNMMTLCGDAFPRNAVGSVTGLSGVGAGVGGIFFTMATGWTLDHYGYAPVFMAAASIPLLAFVVLFLMMDRRPTPAAAT